jgi:hypothetical protein
MKIIMFRPRFVYGRVKEFRSISFGVEVYKWAHEMKIKPLVEVLDQYFKEEAKATEMFEIFDLYVRLNNHVGLEWCKNVNCLKKKVEKTTEMYLFVNFQVLEVESEHAFYSIPFLCIEEQSLLEILGSDRLNLSEVWLVIAILHWGQFKLQVEGRDPEDGANLREKLLPALRLIRFSEFDKNTFEKRIRKLAKLEKVLSKEEQLAIFMSLILKDLELMPPGFHNSQKVRGWSSHFVFTLPDFAPIGTEKIAAGRVETVSFKFHVKQEVEFVGMRFVKTENLKNWEHFSFVLMDSESVVSIGKGDLLGEKTVFGGRVYCKFSPKCILSAATTYVMAFQYQCGKAQDLSSFTFDCQGCCSASCSTGVEHHLTIKEWITLPFDAPQRPQKIFDVKSISMLMKPIEDN